MFCYNPTKLCSDKRQHVFSQSFLAIVPLVSVVSDVILPRSGDRRSSLQGSSRRSSSEVIKRMLYGSATKEDLKNRDVIESMDDESDVTETDTETDTSSVTQEETRRKNLFILKKTTSAGRINFKMRRNSVEDSSERDGSPSPPLNPERPRLGHSASSKTLPRRTKSSSNTNISFPTTLQKSTDRKTSYAFGSSTQRFCNKSENDSRSSQDNLSGPGNITTQFIKARCFHIPPSLRFSDGAGTPPDSAK